MFKEDSIDICRKLLDSLTVVKGFIQLDNNSNQEYARIVLQEADNIEALIMELVNLANKQDDNS